MQTYSKDLIAASTIPIVLSILQKGDNYGYKIIKEVQQLSEGSLNWKEGSLYPVLSKLEKNRLIRSYIKKENGRNRKYYTLNEEGSRFLESIKAEWQSVNQIMHLLWNNQTALSSKQKSRNF